MRNHLRLGPVTLRIGSKHLAPWGYPRFQIGGLSFWSWTNDGSLHLAAYHPRASITWLWYVGITRTSEMFGKKRRARLWLLYHMGNPHVRRPSWRDRFVLFAQVRRGQWHDYIRLPFGFAIIVGHQRAMWRREAA